MVMVGAAIIMAAYFFSYLFFFRGLVPVAMTPLRGRVLAYIGILLVLPILHIFFTFIFYLMGDNRG